MGSLITMASEGRVEKKRREEEKRGEKRRKEAKRGEERRKEEERGGKRRKEGCIVLYANTMKGSVCLPFYSYKTVNVTLHLYREI